MNTRLVKTEVVTSAGIVAGKLNKFIRNEYDILGGWEGERGELGCR